MQTKKKNEKPLYEWIKASLPDVLLNEKIKNIYFI
jgi:hypothetical protein